LSGDIDYTRPLLLGYILKHLLMTDGELVDMRSQLEEFARVEGFAMGTIYTEETETTPAAFEALIAAVNRYEVTTVVNPESTALRGPGGRPRRQGHLRAGNRRSGRDCELHPMIWRNRWGVVVLSPSRAEDRCTPTGFVIKTSLS